MSDLTDKESHSPVQLQASTTAITINLITMGLGSGLLTMPWGVAGSSIVTSCVWLAVVLVLNYWTIMILVRAAEHLQEFDLGGMLSRLPRPMGSILEKAGNAIIIGSQFLVLLGYTIVIVDTIVQLSPVGGLTSSRSVAAGLVTLLVFPLSLLHQKYLAFSSSASIMANIYVIGLLIFYATAPSSLTSIPLQEQGLCVLGHGGHGSITMFSLLMYTIIIQMVIPPMYQELEDRSPERFRSCLVVALVSLFFIFAAVMICGYIAFGPFVTSNVLDNFPTDGYGVLARIAMAICLAGCYPLNVKPMAAPFARSHVTTTAHKPLLEDDGSDIETSHNYSGVSAGVLIATAVIIVAVSVTSAWVTVLGPLNAINGAIQVIGYIGFIPGLVGMYLLPDIGKLQRRALQILIVFSVVTCAVGLYFTDNDVESLTASCVLLW